MSNRSKLLVLVIIFVLFVGTTAFILFRGYIGNNGEWLCENGEWVRQGNPQTAKPVEGCGLIGGQQDEHGCLIPAGYSWCEIKNKCLRAWEEPCTEETPSPSTTPATTPSPAPTPEETGLLYKNKEYGFTMLFPYPWAGYKETKSEYPNFTSVGFSFDYNHQPFTIFQILVYPTQVWQNAKQNSSLRVIEKNETRTIVIDGCWDETGDTTGGGQFDEFQIARCKEVPGILKTFNLTDTKSP